MGPDMSRSARENSKNPVIPDSGSLQGPAPGFDIELMRSLIRLAGIPKLSRLFGGEAWRNDVLAAEVKTIPGASYHGFDVAPVFLKGGWRNVPAPLLNERALGVSARAYMKAGLGSVVMEACRNIGQHAYKGRSPIGAGNARFAPGAVFTREFAFSDEKGGTQRILMCMIADEGPGLANPSRSILDGVGTALGENHRGMGAELSRSLLGIVKSRDGRWLVYDGLNHKRQSAAEYLRNQKREPPSSSWVKPISELDLPERVGGCRKIFFFSHPQSDPFECYRGIVRVVGSYTRS
jgi:anti-sigma regulatory factor (Ser/Thr protein kinase)